MPGEILRKFMAQDAAAARAALARLGEGSAGGWTPLAVHVHVPKCAGTSFNSLLRRSFGERHLDAYTPAPGTCHSVADLAGLLEQHPRTLCLSSHSIRLYPRLLNRRVPLYFCFLREPVQWWVSNLTYLLKNYDALSPEHRAMLPPDCRKMSLREFAHARLSLASSLLPGCSPVVDYFAAPTLRELVGPRLAPPPREACRPEDALALAQHLLDCFFFVGVVEEMSLSLSVLRRKLGQFGLELAPEEAPLLNRSEEYRDDLDWLNPDDEVGRLALARISQDRLLYEHAVKLLRQEAASSDCGR